MLKKPESGETKTKIEEPEESRRKNFNMTAVILIGIAIASAILGAVLVKNFVQEKPSQQIILQQTR